MTDVKRYNARGKNINELVALAGTAIDELIEENQTNFIIDVQDGGHTVEDAEAVLESQRARMATWRSKTLADIRRFLERDCENLNS
jgi:hypothetical protein